MRNPAIALTVSLALVATTSVGAGVVRQLTDEKSVSFDWAMPDGTGSEIFVVTSSNQFAGGSNPDHLFEVAVFDPTTGTGTPLTAFTSSLTHVRHNLSVSEDGQWLAFISDGDLIPGQNRNRNPEAFVVMRDGTQLAQLTDDSTSVPGSVSRLALAGSGNRVAFVSSSDLTGGNPQRVQQVFVIDRDGTNLTQLTQATEGEIQHMWFSDDGTRIAFAHNGDLTGGNPEKNYEVFTIAVGDTSPRQVTSSVTGDSMAANISGDGSTIVFHSTADLTGGNADGGFDIFVADWATATISQVTAGPGGPLVARHSRQPWPTNDGQQIFHVSNQGIFPYAYEVFKINSDGTGRTQLTSRGAEAEHPIVSGDGAQFGVWFDDGLYTATGGGANTLELVHRTAPLQGHTDMSTDGQWLSFISDANPLGTNADGTIEVFAVRSDGTGLVQLTATDTVSSRPAISGDGSRVYFDSGADLTGQDPDLLDEVFGINIDGTGVIQYSSCPSPDGSHFSGYAEVSDDGDTVVFTSLCDLTGGNPDGTGELFRVDADGQNLTQITSFPSVSGLTTYAYWARLDSTGTWVTFTGNANIAGGNPENNFEVWRIRTDGTGFEQITSDTVYDSFFPDISGDGSRIVFRSASDLTGQNADHNDEIFLFEPAANPQIRQLTQTTQGRSSLARLSRDGAWVYFMSSSQFLEDDPDDGAYAMYRYHIDTDTLERSGALGFEDTTVNWWPGVNSDGSVVSYSPQGNATGSNPDFYWEILVADYNAANPPVVSPGPAPTTVSFAPEPGRIRYDVIRGDVADIQDVGGGVIDLGPVLCVEDDSPDTTTAGSDDPDTPAAGQVYFYAFRGTMGIVAGPGSYGTGSNGSERTPGAGACNP